jgi:hypothetical protein
MTAAELAARRPGAKKRGPWHDDLCPTHDDQQRSLSYRDGDRGITFKCHAGCKSRVVAEALARELGVRVADFFFNSNGRPSHSDRRIVATYDYHNVVGDLVYQVVRFEPKTFRQRRPDGADDWTWNLTGVERVPYRLPELITMLKERPVGQHVVFVPEGEKDVEALWALGLVATTNVGGAGKWRPEYTAELVAASAELVVVLPDNDDPGRGHARTVARSCLDVGLTAKILALPDLPPKGDVSDWLDAGHTAAELLALAETTPCITVEDMVKDSIDDSTQNAKRAPDTTSNTPQKNTIKNTAKNGLENNTDGAAAKGLPRIDAGEQDLAHVAKEAWAALKAANEPPTVFRFAGRLARVDVDDRGVVTVKPLGVDELRYCVARVAEWTTKKVMFGKRVTKPTYPPIGVVRDMLVEPAPPLPPLARVVEVPIFTSTGDILSHPGYNAASGVLFVQPRDLVVPVIPGVPLAEDIARARRLLLEELTPDFPFTGDAERAHAVAMLIEPIVRDLIEGPTPIYVIEKPTPGTGASLLAGLVALIATGLPGAAMTEGRDEDEWRKRITAKLVTGAPIFLIDNLRRRLDSAAVSSAITRTVWEDRRLTRNDEMIRVPVRCTWIATGNNPTFSAEMVRRTVRIRLDARVDQPWLRDIEAFRHPDLLAWVHQARGELVWAALVLGQAWLARGRPKPTLELRPLGMFESWSRVMGGILATAEIPGFLTNRQDLYATADAEGAEIRAFLASWWDKYRDAGVTAAQLFELAMAPESTLDIEARTDHGRKVKFGILLSSLRDRRYQLGDDLQVKIAQAGELRRAVLWQLVDCESVSLVSLCDSRPTRAHMEKLQEPERLTETHTLTQDDSDAVPF